jgi:hypothetical protein
MLSAAVTRSSSSDTDRWQSHCCRSAVSAALGSVAALQIRSGNGSANSSVPLAAAVIVLAALLQLQHG